MRPTWNRYTPDQIVGGDRNSLIIGPFGSSLKTSDYTQGGVPLIFVRDIRTADFARPRAFVSPSKAEELRAHTALPGDVLVTKMGDPPGDACVYTGKVPAIVTADCIRLRVSKEFDARFIVHELNAPEVSRQILAITTGAAQQKVSLARFRTAVQFKAPHVEEQRRIAAILDQADAVRAKRRQALAQLDTLERSVFLDMFGDPARNPLGFRTASLGSLATVFRDGPFGSNLKGSHYVEAGVRVVRLQNIGVGRFVDADRAFVTPEHFASLSKHRCLPGDVLIGTMGDPNLRACRQPEWLAEALNKADCVQMRADPAQARSEWVCALLNMPGTLALADSLVLGQTRSRISMGRLRDLNVPVPPVALQDAFADRMASVAASRRRLRSAEQRVEALRSSLQSAAFRGEI